MLSARLRKALFPLFLVGTLLTLLALLMRAGDAPAPTIPQAGEDAPKGSSPTRVDVGVEHSGATPEVAFAPVTGGNPNTLRAFRMEGRGLVTPEGIAFPYELEELGDGGSAEEMAWLLRNGIAPRSYSTRGGVFHDRIDAISAEDGLDFHEIDRLRSFALSPHSETRVRALAMLHQAAMMGSIGALDVLANAYAFGPEGNAVLAEAYALAAWHRGDWLATAGRPFVSFSANERIEAALQASQLIDAFNLTRSRLGLPPLPVDRRPGTALSPPPPPPGGSGP